RRALGGPRRPARGRRGDRFRHDRLRAGARGRDPMKGEFMIELQGIEKVYRTERIETVALSNVNLTVAAGDFISVMGPSGSGKSTLLHLTGRVDVPRKGRVSLGGKTVESFADRHLARLRNEEIGFVFQTFHLVPDLSVVDNVEVPLLYRRMSGKKRREKALA